MLLNRAKGIKSSLEISTLREVSMYINDLQHELFNYKYENEVDKVKEYNIRKLSKMIQNTYIFDLKYKDIEKYIDKIINILEFIEV